MAYDPVNTNSKIETRQEAQALGEAFILPTGDEWKGDVHVMDDGSYMTGKSHSNASIPLIKVLSAPEFPHSGLVGRKKIFDDVFKKVSSWSALSEGGLGTIKGKLTALNENVNNLTDIINLALNKIENYIETQNIQSETNGTGAIIDNELHYILEETSSKDENISINTIEYIHSDSTKNTYIFDGNAESGLTNDGILTIKDMEVKLDMVSRTGAPLELPELENILTLDDTYAFGFNGIIKVKLSQQAMIGKISLPTNGMVTAVSIDGGETYLADWENFPTTSVSEIIMHLEYTSPIPFETFVTNDLTTDLMGSPQIDQYRLSPAVYQRTSLDLGKLKLSSVNYQDAKEFESGPYHLQAGYLKSITLSAIEVLEEETEYDTYFLYNLVIGGQEYPITPWTRNGSFPKIYYINSNLSETARLALSEQGIGFIDTNLPEVSFSLKTKLVRPEVGYLTPIVKGFTFNYATSLSGGSNG